MYTNSILTPSSKITRLFQSCNTESTEFPYKIHIQDPTNKTDDDSTNVLPSDDTFINTQPGQTQTFSHDILNGRGINYSIQCISALDDTLTSQMMYYDPLNITNSAFQFTVDSNPFYNNNTNESSGTWYALTSTTPTKVTHIGIIDSNVNSDLYAQTFAFETSDDGVVWTRNHLQTNHVYTTSLVGIRLSEPVTATYFRFYCVQGADDMIWELTRILLFDMNDTESSFKPVTSELSMSTISSTESEITNNSVDTHYIIRVQIV
jgi:hypothetical protein